MSYMFGRYRVQVNDFVHISIFKLQGVGTLTSSGPKVGDLPKMQKKNFGVAIE